jgi:hypothetical protein
MIFNRMRRLLILITLTVFSFATNAANSDPNSEAKWFEETTPEVKTNMVGNWEHKTFPNKRPIDFVLTDGVIEARSEGQFSVLRQRVDIPAEQLGKIGFSWFTQNHLPGAHTGQAGYDDSPARVLFVFDGDRSKFDIKDRMLSDLSLMLTGEELAYATLSYAWGDSDHKLEEIISNPRTHRIRNLLLEVGDTHAQTWRTYERDIQQDFQLAFQEPLGRLQQVILMVDTDNTKGKAYTKFRDIKLLDKAGNLILQLQ